jgi:hypothetical protein
MVLPLGVVTVCVRVTPSSVLTTLADVVEVPPSKPVRSRSTERLPSALRTTEVVLVMVSPRPLVTTVLRVMPLSVRSTVVRRRMSSREVMVRELGKELGADRI